MKQTIIPMKKDTKVVMSIRDDLYLEGVPEAQFTAVVSDADTFRMKEENGIFYVRSDSDCKVTLPDTASVTIEKVDGDADIRGMKSRLIVGKIGGDFSLYEAESASIEVVGGDCALRELKGMVEIARVGGDLLIEQSSQTLVGNVGGDLEVDTVSGKFESKVGGDVEIKLADPNLAPMRITAGGDIQLVVPTEANAQLVLAAGGDISIQTHDNQAEFEQVARNIILGEGGAIIDMKAGGDIEISDKEIIHFGFGKVFNNFDNNWKRFSADIEKRISQSMAQSMRSVDMASRRVEEATQRAQGRIDEAMQRVQQKGIYTDRGSKFSGFPFEKPAEPPVMEKRGVSENERMLILKMLAEKKITVEEAEKLLKALEG